MGRPRAITQSSLNNNNNKLRVFKPKSKPGRPPKPIDGEPSKKTRSKRVNNGKEQYRSNLQTVIKIVNSFSLSDAHKKLLEESFPFWDLYNVILCNGIDNAMCQKSDIDVSQIITYFDKKRCSFYLGGTYVSITKKDVEDTFGISGGQTKITLVKSKDKTDLHTRRFSNTKTLNKKVLLNLLSTAIKGQSENDIEDVPKLLTLLLLDVFFVPTMSTSLDKAYIDYVDDLSKIKTFDWSGHIFEKLLTSICKHKSMNPRKVTGCVMALPYWLMENFNIGKPKNPNARLLCQKWNLQDLTSSTKKKTISKVCQDKGRRISVNGKKRPNGYKGNEIEEQEEEYMESIENEGESEEESTIREDEEDDSRQNEETSEEESEDAKSDNNEEENDDEEDGNDEYNDYGCNIVYDVIPLNSYEVLEDELSDDTPLAVAVSQSKEKKKKIKELKVKIKKKDKALVGGQKDPKEMKKNTQQQVDQLAHDLKIKHNAKSRKFQEQQMNTFFDKQIVEEDFVEEHQEASQSVQEDEHDAESGQIQEQQIDTPFDRQIVEEEAVEVHQITSQYVQEGMRYERVDSAEEEDENKQLNTSILKLRKNNRKKTKRGPNFDWGSGKRCRRKREAVVEEVDSEETDSEEVEFETVYADEMPDVSVGNIKKESRIDKNWDLAKYFTDEEFNKLQQIHDKNGMNANTVLWKKPGVIDSYVTLGDIYLILEHQEITNNLINAHAELLRRKYNQNSLRNFVIFDSLIWTYIVRRDQHAIIRKERIDSIIRQYFKDGLFSGKMLFPMNSNGHKDRDIAAGHWTLLVLDVKGGRWLFYNSQGPRTTYVKDKYAKDALVVKKYIEELMEEPSKSSSGEIDKENIYKFPLYRCVNSIQQESNSLDCGIVVCYLMETIASGRNLKSSMSNEELASYKAQLVSSFTSECQIDAEEHHLRFTPD